MTWKKVNLNSVCEINVGKTPARDRSEYFGIGKSWVSIADMNGKVYINETKEEVTDEGIRSANMKVVPENTVLFSFKLSVGKVCITGKPLYTNEAIAALPIIDKNRIDTKYLYYVMQSQDFSHLGERAAKGLTLNKEKLNRIQIPLPPLPIQQKIAAILDQADALRKKDQQLLAKYDELLQAVFYDMFGDPVRNEKGWEKKKLGELTIIVRGGSPRPIDKYLGGTFPWIKISDGSKGNSLYIESTKEHITKEGLTKTRLLPSGSLIFANCGVSLGFARIIRFEGCIHDGWLAMSKIDDSLLNKIFLLKSLNFITDYFRKSAPDGTQPNLNTSIMKNFPQILPPIGLQNKFSEIVFNLDKQNENLKCQAQKSEELFQSLLQKGFKGELVKE